MQKAISFINGTVVCVKGSAYRTRCWYMTKNYAISIINNSNMFDGKVGF